MPLSLTILVVDDDRDNADSMAELFVLEGHRAEVAYSGLEALEACRRVPFDIAFIDVMMPGKNGIESFLEIKRLNPSARVYMMTGYSVEQLIGQAIDNGALGVLSKPFAAEDVLAALDQAGPNGLVVVPADEPGVGRELKQSIEASGRSCGLVTDGPSQLLDALHGGAEALIVDLERPLIDGIACCAAMRQQRAASRPVVLAAEAGPHDDMFAAFADVELTGILMKPFDPAVLIAKLDRLASASRV